MAYVNPLRDPRDRCDPGRQVPLFRDVSQVMRRPMTPPPAAAPVILGSAPGCGGYNPSALDLARDEVAGAEASLRDIFAAYKSACAALGDANRRVRPCETPAFIVKAVLAAGGSIRPVVWTDEQMRERKSAAFRRLNEMRARLRAADRRLRDARAALVALVGEGV